MAIITTSGIHHRDDVAYADGDLATAADAYTRAAMLAPDNSAVRNNLGQVLADAGCMTESRNQLARAIALAANSPLAATIEATRAKIEAGTTPGVELRCSLTGRDWPR